MKHLASLLCLLTLSASAQTLNVQNATVGTLTVVATAAPAVTDEPDSLTRTNGESATFSVTATGTAPLAYQWYFTNALIADATATSYTIGNVIKANEGSGYNCIITNLYGSDTSTVAYLWVSNAAGGIEFVQCKGTNNTGSPDRATAIVTLTNNCASGNALVAIGRYKRAEGVKATFTDSRGNVWTPLYTNDFYSQYDLIWAVATNIAAGSCVVTQTTDAAVAWSALTVAEFSGVAATSPLGQKAVYEGVTTNAPQAMSCGPVTTTEAGELVLCNADTYAGLTTAGAGFTDLIGANSWMKLEYLVKASPGSISGIWTNDTAPDDYTISLITLKP